MFLVAPRTVSFLFTCASLCIVSWLYCLLGNLFHKGAGCFDRRLIFLWGLIDGIYQGHPCAQATPRGHALFQRPDAPKGLESEHQRWSVLIVIIIILLLLFSLLFWITPPSTLALVVLEYGLRNSLSILGTYDENAR